jgi:hypothetical protein
VDTRHVATTNGGFFRKGTCVYIYIYCVVVVVVVLWVCQGRALLAVQQCG